MKKWNIGILLMTISLNIQAQTMIKGRVFDQSNGEALAGANILAPSSGRGTVSNAQGYFELEAQDSLQVSLIGYQSRKIALSPDNSFLRITLNASSLELNEIVVSAFQSERKLLETSGAISIITEAELHRDNDIIIAPALNRVPGVYMHSGTYSTNRIVIRGIGSRSLFSTNKVRAYLNEIPLTTGEGETTIEDIDLRIIDRVEVIKGPASSIYGAGLGGTINLKTKRADYQQTSFRQENLVGSFGLFRNVSSFRSSSDKSNLNLVYSSINSDGYRENNEYNRQSLTALGEFYPDEKSRVTVLGNLISLKSFIPSSLNQTDFEENPEAAAQNWASIQGFEDYERALLGFSYQRDFNRDWAIQAGVFANFRNAHEPRPFNILRESNQVYGFRTYLTYSPQIGSVSSKFTLGSEYFKEWYGWRTFEILNNNREVGSVLSDQEEIRQYYNLFAQADFTFGEKFILTAGLNINETDYELTDLFFADSLNQSGEYGFEPIISPRVGLNYKIQPQIALYASASHGFSPPSVEETLTPEGQINPDIEPETGWNFEIGSRGSLFAQRLSFDVALYRMQIQNLLVARRTAEDAFVGVNAGQTTHQGLELALSYLIYQNPKGWSLQAFVNATFSDFEFDEFVDGENDFSGNQLTGAPETTINAGLDLFSDQGFYGNLNLQHVGEMPIRDDNTVFSDAYTVLNLKWGYQRTFFNHLNINLYGGIQNLGDEKYASMLQINAAAFGNALPRYFYPGLPRNYYGGLAVSYIF